MLPIAITLLGLAAIIIGFHVAGAIGAGALTFSIGFSLLGVIAALSFWRSRAV